LYSWEEREDSPRLLVDTRKERADSQMVLVGSRMDRVEECQPLV
jgi:hypothetical protein